MQPHTHLCLVLHNHQPIGNFADVFEQAYRDSYLPFLNVFEPFESVHLSLHTSGPLMLWLAENHPDYLDRVGMLVESGRVEIIGGPKYEPILTMLPSRDRVGQIQAYGDWLESRFGIRPSGMWMPERVWESTLTHDVASAGIRYTVLDDFHFRGAGLSSDELLGDYIVEDQGKLLRVFPGSEHLRYTIPFRPVDETIDYLRELAHRRPGSVITFGDDGEKFGTWPDTKTHVYDDGWLHAFFEALTSESHWLHAVTLAEATERTRPLGKAYLPDASYREMTQWALPTEQQETLEDLTHTLHDDAHWTALQPFVRGGFWRNFKTKYEETNEMYARMMYVSDRLAAAETDGMDDTILADVRDHLYRGQCNCPYWHGAFGGIYLPHLRNAIFAELIQAESKLQQLDGTIDAVTASTGDYNFDGNQEIRLANENLVAWIDPASGGRLYEWDVRDLNHNLLATLTRRPEAYHRKVLAGPSVDADDVASIHDRVVFKQKDLDQRVQYDAFARKSLMDHFFDNEATLESVAAGESMERGDFVDLPYQTKLRRGGDRVQVHMSRMGNAWGIPITLTKAVTLSAGSSTLSVAYLLEDLPPGRPLHFAIELNFAGMPGGAEDRFFSNVHGHRLGHLGERLDQSDVHGLQLADQWLGLDVALSIDRPSGIWAFPIETVSQSEGGFELVHQSVCVMPHWIIAADAEGRWAVKMELETRVDPAKRADRMTVQQAVN
ncbi:MAG: alpha-amylase/4-alpha-glucanotransferase domain-containing protein [Planctomycetota bacterium]